MCTDVFDRQKKDKLLFDKVKAVKSKKFQYSHANTRSASGEALHESDVLSRWREYGEDLFKKPTDEVPLTRVHVAEKRASPFTRRS